MHVYSTTHSNLCQEYYQYNSYVNMILRPASLYLRTVLFNHTLVQCMDYSNILHMHCTTYTVFYYGLGSPNYAHSLINDLRTLESQTFSGDSSIPRTSRGGCMQCKHHNYTTVHGNESPPFKILGVVTIIHVYSSRNKGDFWVWSQGHIFCCSQVVNPVTAASTVPMVVTRG